jgi:hypothetical protein
MRPILFFLLTSSTSILFAQTKQFKSPTTYTFGQTKTTQSVERDVIISNETITITKLLNGGTEDAKFKIERIEKKKYMLVSSTWYYCVDTNETISMEDPTKMVHRKTIIIIPESDLPNGLINVFHFADEVTVFQIILEY